MSDNKLTPNDRLSKVPVSVDLGIAVGSAMVTSFCVSPFVLTVDKAVIQAAAGTETLGKALVKGVASFVKTPGPMLRSGPYWIMWGVYSATYIAANTIDVYNERKHVSAAYGQINKLVLVTAVNMGASIAKDVIFTKMFGKKDAAGAAKKKMPMSTYAAFLCRDMLAISGGFILPPYVSKAM